MSQRELLALAVAEMDRLEIGYMLTGSHASSLQGHPRSTHDIDIVIAIMPKRARKLASAFPGPRFYADADMAEQSVRALLMFNVLDNETGEKIDFWPLVSEPFPMTAFKRRQKVTYAGIEISVSAPEDTIIQKLAWAKQSGGSEKQFLDVLHVYEVQHARLDLAYVEEWVRELGLEESWTRVLKTARPVGQ